MTRPLRVRYLASEIGGTRALAMSSSGLPDHGQHVLGESIPMSTVRGMVDATAMPGVTPVSVVNYPDASQFPAYSGK